MTCNTAEIDILRFQDCLGFVNCNTHIPLDGVFATLMAITKFLKNYSKSQQKRRQSYDLGTSRF